MYKDECKTYLKTQEEKQNKLYEGWTEEQRAETLMSLLGDAKISGRKKIINSLDNITGKYPRTPCHGYGLFLRDHLRTDVSMISPIRHSRNQSESLDPS